MFAAANANEMNHAMMLYTERLSIPKDQIPIREANPTPAAPSK